MTRFILDSGDPEEYKTTKKLFEDNGKELWGSTTNPSLIAKKLSASGKKLTKTEAFDLQKDIVTEILTLVPGAVSAEVYADQDTSAQEMIEQGREIALWDKRVVIKLPTTLEGMKARTDLRKNGIVTNNTLVFSEEQIFAICLHEQLIQNEFPSQDMWPSFISPFVGRLDDIGQNGMTLVKNGMDIKRKFSSQMWMLEASVRSSEHMDKGVSLGCELITAPLKAYQAWFAEKDMNSQIDTSGPIWQIPAELMKIQSLQEYFDAIESKKLSLDHELTVKGIQKFVDDWNAILN